MLYLLTRVGGARDWGTGQVLSANLLGKSSTLNLHHIFLKARLYEHGYTRPEVVKSHFVCKRGGPGHATVAFLSS